ncbi:MAG: aldo/keto reductase family protein [Acidimicrobiales bacterium]
MDYRHLGRSGMTVSAISYGNWITHGDQVDEEAAIACVHAALDVGITTFDTADVYAGGAAEETLARALAGQRRDSVEICTKVYWPMGARSNHRGLSRKHIIEACHASLGRLKTDHIDLYQAHRYDVEAPLEETLRAFDDLVRAGKVNYVGVSEWTAGQIEAATQMARDMGLDSIVANQPQYSLLWRVIEPEILPLCRREGIGQIVWSPLAQGVLTGKYRVGQQRPQESRAGSESRATDMGRFLDEAVLSRVEEFAKLCAEAGLAPGNVALAWVLDTPGISSAIVGASRPGQIIDNAGALEVDLTSDFKSAVEAVLGPVCVDDPSRVSQLERRP